MAIKMTAEEGRAAASDVDSCAGDCRDAFSTLRSRIGGLRGDLEGAFLDAYEDKYGEWDTSATGVLDALEGLGTWLRTAADQIEELDTTLASQG